MLPVLRLVGDGRASAREVSQSNLHVSCRLKVISRNSTIINLESPHSSKTPKKEVECAHAHVHWHPHCFVEATYHIGLCSCNKFEHDQFSRSQDIDAFLTRLRQTFPVRLPESCIIFTMDVCNLYGSIPIQEGIESVMSLIHENTAKIDLFGQKKTFDQIGL